jgi:integrase/recombinase XerD
MSGLRARAEEYLAMRRALGFRLTTQGRHLMGFVGFCEDRGAASSSTTTLTPRSPPSSTPAA